MHYSIHRTAGAARRRASRPLSPLRSTAEHARARLPNSGADVRRQPDRRPLDEGDQLLRGICSSVASVQYSMEHASLVGSEGLYRALPRLASPLAPDAATIGTGPLRRTFPRVAAWSPKLSSPGPWRPTFCPGHRAYGLRLAISPINSRTYRLRGARQNAAGKTARFRTHPVATTPGTPDRYWASPLAAGSPVPEALRRFAFARHGCAPMTSTRRPLAGVGQGTTARTPPCRPGTPGRRPCLFGVRFPLSGLWVRIFTSSLAAMPLARPPVALRAPSVPSPATTSISTTSGMRVISLTSPAPTLISPGRLSHRLLAQGEARNRAGPAWTPPGPRRVGL